VEFTLTAPTASFLNQLTLVGGFIVPKEAAEVKDFTEKPVGTGPYMLKEWVRQDHLTLVANPDYWGKAPTIKTAVIRVIPQQSQQVIEYEGGNLDVAIAPEPDLPRLRDDAKLSKELQSIPILSIFHLRVNLNDPVMSKPEVRVAFAMAIDRDTIIKTVLGGQGSPAHGVIPPGLSAYDKNYNPFPRDIAKAKALLAKAGYADGVDIEIRTGQVETENRVLAAIQQQVAEAGIRVKINSTEKSLYDQDRGACKMQMGTVGWSQDYADPDDFTLLLTGPSGSRKNCGYNDYPGVDQVIKLLAQGSTMPVGTARDAVYRQAEKIAMDIAVLIPIYHGTRSVLVNPRLVGVVVDANSLARFAKITLAVRA
jgi:peptide/nickel transport system substrate-binding protein